MNLSTVLRRALLMFTLALVATSTKAVVGGVPAEPDSRPWLGAMLYTSVEADPDCLASGGSEVFCQQVCAASLIAPNWAITAAHCLINRTNPDFIKLAVGNTDLNGSGITQLDVAEFFAVDGVPGPSNIYQDDLALLQLATPQPGPFASLASVADATELLALPDSDDRLEILGWGQLDTGAFPSDLQRVRTDLDQTNCGGLFVGVSMFCSWEASPSAIEIDDAGDETPLDDTGEDACVLDSGGPLLYHTDAGTEALAGIVSWGVDSNCGASTFGTAHTRIDYFLNWIETASAGASLPMVDLGTEINGPTSTTAATETLRVYLRNGSDNTPIDNSRLEIRYQGTGALGSPVAGGLNCTASAGNDGYDCVPQLLPMAPGAQPYVDLEANSLVADSTLEVTATVFRDDGEQDYRSVNDQHTHLLSRSTQPDLVLESLGATAWFDAGTPKVTLFYRVANHSETTAASAPVLDLTTPPAWLPAGGGGPVCSNPGGWPCSPGDLAAGESQLLRYEFTDSNSASPTDFTVIAVVSSTSGDFPTQRGGNLDTRAETTVTFPAPVSPEPEPPANAPPAGASSSGGGTTSPTWLILTIAFWLRNRLRGSMCRSPA